MLQNINMPFSLPGVLKFPLSLQAFKERLSNNHNTIINQNVIIPGSNTSIRFVKPKYLSRNNLIYF